jgi:hypothetical protein
VKQAEQAEEKISILEESLAEAINGQGRKILELESRLGRIRIDVEKIKEEADGYPPDTIDYPLIRSICEKVLLQVKAPPET